MQAKTREALKAYAEKFGREFDEDLSKLKNSEETALVARIQLAIDTFKAPKKTRSRASLITGSIVDEK